MKQTNKQTPETRNYNQDISSCWRVS